MLRSSLVSAMLIMVVPALIVAVKAQSGPAPAEKGRSASDDPFADGPAAVTKAPAQRKAMADDDAQNPFSGPAPKDLKPFGKSAVLTQGLARSKPAAKKLSPSVDAKRPLCFGENAILKALEDKTTFDFVETPLKDVFDYLQDKHGIPIKLDTAALKEAGVDLNTQVNCTIGDLPLRSALRIMLGELQLEWTIWSDVLWITTPAKTESDEHMVVRIYDVSDLVAETQDQPFRGNGLPAVGGNDSSTPASNGGMGSAMGVSGSGGMGSGMGGGFFSIPPEASIPAVPSSPSPATFRKVINCTPVVGTSEQIGAAGRSSSLITAQVGLQASPSCGGPVSSRAWVPHKSGMDALSDLITNTVATKTWGDNGGTGTISAYGNLLCISQTFHIQGEVKALLAILRAQRRAVPTVVVELHWLWLDGKQYEELLGGAKSSNDGQTQLAVDAKALELLSHKAPGFRGRIACSNGQLVHLASGDRRSIIVNTIPVIGSGVGYSPVVQVANSGVIVELRPTVAPGDTTATIDVQSIVTRWGKPQSTVHVGAVWPPSRTTEGTSKDVVHQETTADPAGSGSCPVQRPSMPTQQLATTVRVPLGKPVVLGGMTYAPAESAGMNTATDHPVQLYLIATTSIAN